MTAVTRNWIIVGWQTTATAATTSTEPEIVMHLSAMLRGVTFASTATG